MINKIQPNYTDRESKQHFVSKKYRNILKGAVLDVGADEGYIKKYLQPGVIYQGIGLGGENSDIKPCNLEKEKIPYRDNSFDCVMCLDVLEHLENIHDVFDELCRVSNKYVLISLPNPYADFINCIRNKPYSNEKGMKFYNLPIEREEDRHKWFYSPTEAKRFIEYRANKQGFIIIDFYYNGQDTHQEPERFSLKQCLKKLLFNEIFYRSDIDMFDIQSGTMWWVLEKQT